MTLRAARAGLLLTLAMMMVVMALFFAIAFTLIAAAGGRGLLGKSG